MMPAWGTWDDDGVTARPPRRVCAAEQTTERNQGSIVKGGVRKAIER